MRRAEKKDIYAARFPAEFHHAVANVENDKRRRSLSPIAGTFQFFDRILTIKKLQDFVFITKTAARNR